VGLECRSRLEMTFMATPAARPMVAVPWRRSWSRIGGSPAWVTSWCKWSVTSAGCSAVPGFGGEHQAGVDPGRAGEVFAVLPGSVGA
jgi:hypothetical protein